MSADSTGREVFEEIDPDPDAVLAEFDVESPDDLLEAETSGAHDTIPDEEIDVDDTTAAELFAGLAEVETTDGTVEETTERNVEDDDSTRDVDDLEFEFVGDSAVTVLEDGNVIDTSAAELSALTGDESTRGEPTDVDGEAETADGSDSTDGTGDSSDGIDTTDSSGTLTVRSSSAAGLELVGPDPTPTRVTNDAFSSVDAVSR